MLDKLKEFLRWNKLDKLLPQSRVSKLTEGLDEGTLDLMIHVISSCKNEVMLQTHKVRDVEGLIYRDGSVAMCGVIINKFKEIKKNKNKNTTIQGPR